MLKQNFKKIIQTYFQDLLLKNCIILILFLHFLNYHIMKSLVLVTHVLKKETILKKIVDLFFEDSIMFAGVNKGHFCTLR